MLFDGDGNRMTPSHAVKKGARYRYYVSGALITRDRTEGSAGLRIPAAEIEQPVSSRVHRWLLDPASICKSTAALLPDASTQQGLVARAAEIGKRWPELPVPRKRAVLTALRGILADHINGTAVLEYGPTEILPSVDAASKHPARLCRPGSPSQLPRPARKAGFSTFESGCGRETDSHLEGRVHCELVSKIRRRFR